MPSPAGVRLAERVVLVVVLVALVVNLVAPLLQDGPVVPAVASGLLSALGVGLLRRRPVVALVVVSLAGIVASLGGADPTGAWSIAVFVAFLQSLRRLPAVLVGSVVGVTSAVAVALHEGQVSLERPTASIAAVCGVAAAAAGSAVRSNLRWRAELEGRAHDAIENRRAAVDRSVAEERVRIARDLHDSIGHHIAVVSVHLGTAQVTVSEDDGATRASLESARDAVRAVLVETQQVLRVLRRGDSPSDLEPPPDHAGVPALVASARSAGLVVDVTLRGLDRPLAPVVSTAVHRIVQEALTNALKHGGGQVSLRVEIAEAVLIEAANVRADGGGPATGPDRPGGHGLIGMTERATSVGGRVEHWTEGRVFWLRAVLPADAPSTGAALEEARR